jgi:hypothetical protein
MTQPDNPERDRGAQDEMRDDASHTGLSEGDPHVLRIHRLGRKWFGVSNCLATFGHRRAPVSERSPDAAGATFVHGVPMPESPVVVCDAREDPDLCKHPSVTAIPFVRFHAARPVVAAVSLVDQTPRPIYRNFQHTHPCIPRY